VREEGDESRGHEGEGEGVDVITVGNTIVQLVQELFPYQWAAIPPEEQQEFSYDVQNCLMLEDPSSQIKTNRRRQSSQLNPDLSSATFRRTKTASVQKKQKKEDKKEYKDLKPSKSKVPKSKKNWGMPVAILSWNLRKNSHIWYFS